MLRRSLLLIWLSLLAGPALAQTMLRGRVLDAETQQPIPNAQVGVADNRIGTSTNADGRFALCIPPEYQTAQLEVALLGYRKYRQALPPLLGPELRIALQISPAALGEVRVTASVLGIVREAVARISRNYPVRPTRLTGFYRESDNDSLDRPRYLVEGLLTVFKAPYQQRTADGDVQIRQSRKIDLRPAGQVVRIDWAGGPFIAHRDDFVHRRTQFTDPAFWRGQPRCRPRPSCGKRCSTSSASTGPIPCSAGPPRIRRPRWQPSTKLLLPRGAACSAA